MIVLVFETGPYAGQEHELPGPTIRVGSAESADVRLIDPKASPDHCMITETKQGLILRDLGSKFGTRVGTNPNPIIRPVRLRPGDRIRIGETVIQVHDEPSTTRPEAPASLQAGLRTQEVRGSRDLEDEPPTMMSEPARDPVDTASTRLLSPTATSGGITVVDPHPTDEQDTVDDPSAARLVFLGGPHDGRRVYFDEGPLSLGRGEANDVVIADHQLGLASFRITKAAGVHRLEPLRDSPRINGKVIPKAGAVLGHGQVITLGASEIEYLAPGMDMTAGDAMATVVMREPLFAYQGEIQKKSTLEIGRDPSSDVYLEGPEVERNHARLWFDFPFFYLIALDGAPVYVDDQRIVKLRLDGVHTAAVGGYEINLEVQGFRCGVTVALTEPETVLRTKFAQAADANPYMTICRMPGDFDLPKKEAEQVDREALIWKEPHDVKRTWRIPLLVMTGILSALGVAATLVATGGGSFLSRPISQPHKEAGAQCVSCHETFEGPIQAGCVSCHQDQAARPKHAEASCIDCHMEHPKRTGLTALVDGRCAKCHAGVDRHQVVQQARSPAKMIVPEGNGLYAANLKADFGVSGLHRRHVSVEKKCAACHEQEAPYAACFGCHAPVAALSRDTCADCHREHGDQWASAPREPPLVPSAAGTAMLTVLLLFFPMGLAFFGHALFKRRTRRTVKRAERAADEPLRCDGVERGKAKRLPRLLVNKCTGSADCVEACPYQVLEMENNRPVIRSPELCHECGTCVEKCGPGALMMMAPGEPLPMLSYPALDPNYQTNIPGLYVIGEAAGKPLVKNGINVGYWTIEHMKHEGLAPGDGSRIGAEHDVVIAGSGPAGISAAMTAAASGLDYVLLERREVFASTVYDYPKKKKLMESPEGVARVGPLWIGDTTREEVLDRWRQDVDRLNVKYGVSATGIEQGTFFTVATNQGRYTAKKVILAPGTRAFPRKLGKPGEDLPKVHYRLADAEEHRGQKIMIVGAGDSALEAAVQLAEVHGGSNRVSIVNRKTSFGRAKPRNQKTLQAMIDAGKITVHLEANVEEIRQRSVLLDTGVEEDNDLLLIMAGTLAPGDSLEKQFGIKKVKKSIDWEPPPSDQPAFKQFE